MSHIFNFALATFFLLYYYETDVVTKQGRIISLRRKPPHTKNNIGGDIHKRIIQLGGNPPLKKFPFFCHFPTCDSILF